MELDAASAPLCLPVVALGGGLLLRVRFQFPFSRGESDGAPGRHREDPDGHRSPLGTECGRGPFSYWELQADGNVLAPCDVL